MSRLDTKALARECASPLFWRRQTAHRLLAERQEPDAAPALRELLAARDTEASAIVVMLRALDEFGAPTPSDLQPFIRHTDAAVRVHALQLADRWFGMEKGRALLDATLAAAATETNPRVQIQFALSLGETHDPRIFAVLVRFARQHPAVRWMDAALLCSLRGGELPMFEALLTDPGGATPFLPALVQVIAARETELAAALNLVVTTKPEMQTILLNAMVKGRNAPRQRLAAPSARAALASLAASPFAEVRAGARALEDTFVPVVADDQSLVPAGRLPPVGEISEAAFRRFLAALARPRDLKRGHEIFLQACATCHRIGNEGSDVGPDMLGQLGSGDESLLKDILMPNERIRPGYETTLLEMRDGGAITGLLKSDDATSLTLAQAGGIEQVVLRKNIIGVRRLATSLMPSFAEGLNPSEVADLLAWLRSHLGPGPPKTAEPQNRTRP